MTNNKQITTISNLLHSVNRLIEQSEEVAKLKGENFNIFSVLNIEKDEVRTHNRFISELLNTKGSHNMGDAFVQLFYDVILNSKKCKISNPERITDPSKESIIDNLKKSKIGVKREYTLGSVDMKNVTGGSIDICIYSNSGKGQLRIENKIDAEDQEKQIARYCHSHEKENNIIIYLTKNGKKPSEYSYYNQIVNEDYFLLSYEEDILYWLGLCYQKSTDQPILRETIKQYIILIKKITNQNTSNNMKDELLEQIISSPQNYRAAIEIARNLDNARSLAYSKILKLIEHNLPSKFTLQTTDRNDGGFIPVINLELSDKKYSIGINIELGNNYFFFCAIEDGESRQAINNSQIFNDLSATICNNLNHKKNKNGWVLTEIMKFNHRFDLEETLSKTNEQQEKGVKELIQEIISVIDESKIETYITTLELTTI